MGVVANDLEILEVVIKEDRGLVEVELRVGARLAGQLLFDLLHVVVINMAIAAES